MCVMNDKKESYLDQERLADQFADSEKFIETFPTEDAVVLVKKKDHEQLADGEQRTLQEEELAAVHIPGSMEDPISYKETALQTEQIDQDKIPMLHCPVESAFVHFSSSWGNLKQILMGIKAYLNME